MKIELCIEFQTVASSRCSESDFSATFYSYFHILLFLRHTLRASKHAVLSELRKILFKQELSSDSIARQDELKLGDAKQSQ